MSRSGIRRSVGPVVALVLLGAALMALRLELRDYHYKDLVHEARSIPARWLWEAGLLTALNYLVLAIYDALGFRYVRRAVPWGRVAFTSFTAYAFSHNMGFGALTGTAVRYRLYSGRDLGAGEIAKIIAFAVAIFWLGFLPLAGLAFTIAPPVLPPQLHVPFASVRVLGVVFLCASVGYLVWSGVRRRPIRIWRWEFQAPPLRLSLAGLVTAAVDWVLAAAVFYVLLPPEADVPFLRVLSVFLLAQVVGQGSGVPGGVGVFEAVMLGLLHPHVPTPVVAGALMVYRVIYYLMPFCVALLLLAAAELKLAKYYDAWISPLVPHLAAFTTFVGGAVLLISGATPAQGHRMAWLRDLLPLPVVEISHFLGSVAGAAMLFLARGIQRRLNIAYPATIALLIVGIVASLLKGLDYEEALALSLMLAAFVPCRRHFYRKASLIEERFSPGWTVAIVVVLMASAALGFFAYKQVNYRTELWWHFSFRAGGAPRFLRAEVGAAVVAMVFGLAWLIRPARHEGKSPSGEDLEKARAIIEQTAHTGANAALLGDKMLLFNDESTAFIMYGVQRRSWIALGDPVGPPGEHEELAWRFRELSDRQGGWTVFHQVPPASLHMYIEMGLSLLKIGEEARVRLESWSLEGSRRREFRQVRHRFENEGCRFEVVPAEAVPALLPELRRISDAWLAAKDTREKRFSIGYFDEAYLRRFPMALVRGRDRVLAFANLWATAGKEELSVDLMRYVPETPNGVMDYLFAELMLWGRQAGYKWFNLGVAPLAGLEDHRLGPLWNRLGNLISRLGEPFYHFKGLHAYKDKFDPVWEPRFLVHPGPLVLPNVLMDFAALVSGGVKGVVGK